MDIFEPIERFAEITTYDFLRIAPESYYGSAIDFFIYDFIKIGILLILINFLMAAVRYYFPVEKVRNILAGRRWFGLDYLFAALLGAATPFCSCSSIPLFIGFLSAGIPLGITFAFLISSPLINESSLYLLPAIFGIKAAVLYNLLGISIAVMGGMLIQKLRLEKFVRKEFLNFKSRSQVEVKNRQSPLPARYLAAYFWKDGLDITKKILPYAALGVAIGALIHGFVPQNLIERYLYSESVWNVPIAVLLGAPLYANSVSVIPIMEALAGKGIPLGTILAFMTSIVTLSIPEALMLKKVMRWQLLAIFFSITITGIIAIGYIFNLMF